MGSWHQIHFQQNEPTKKLNPTPKYNKSNEQSHTQLAAETVSGTIEWTRSSRFTHLQSNQQKQIVRKLISEKRKREIAFEEIRVN